MYYLKTFCIMGSQLRNKDFSTSQYFVFVSVSSSSLGNREFSQVENMVKSVSLYLIPPAEIY